LAHAIYQLEPLFLLVYWAGLFLLVVVLLLAVYGLEDEYSTEYSHVLISGESEDPEEVCNIIKNILENEEVSQNDFERSKKRIYGEFVEEFNDVEEIGRIFLQDSIKGINTIEYIDKYEKIDLEYVNKIKKELFNEKSQILSIIKNK
jgi:predicted Zn-dependent peptidase